MPRIVPELVELRLLLALCEVRPDAARIAEVRGLLQSHGPQLDWGLFLDQAARHRVEALVGRNLLRYGFSFGDNRLLVPPHLLLVFAYTGNRRRNEVLFAEFGTVLRTVAETGVRYAVRKGPALIERVYPDPGVRQVSDLDVLIRRDDLSTVAEALTEIGYVQGRMTPDNRRIEPFERATRIFWAGHVNNALPMLRIGTAPEAGRFAVDLCLSIFQPKSMAEVPVEALLDRAVPARVCGEDAFVLAPADELLDLCAHLYKEADSRYYIQRGTDLRLMKFLDIAEWLRVHGRPDTLVTFTERVRASGAHAEVYFALHHTARLYPSRVPLDLLAALRPADCSYLDEYGHLDGEVGRWARPFEERLFDPRRMAELVGASSIPHA